MMPYNETRLSDVVMLLPKPILCNQEAILFAHHVEKIRVFVLNIWWPDRTHQPNFIEEYSGKQ